MSRHPSGSRPSAPSMITMYDVYDAPGQPPQPWLPNIWRIRFILNYKRLHYKTVWLQLQDVERTLSSIHAPYIIRDGRPVYTLPVLIDPTQNPNSPQVLSNANIIAEYLESVYPARPVFPEGSRALQTLFVHFVQDVVAKPLLPIMVPLSYQHLPHQTQTHFQVQPGATAALTGPRREQAWGAVKEQFDFLATIMDKNQGDSYGDETVAMGRDLTYADFAVCSILIWIERMAARDGWSRVKTWNGGRWLRLWDRCRQYMDVV